MVRDLKDPRAEELVRRHGSYWRNEEGGGEGRLWGRPLFQVRRAVPLADTAVPEDANLGLLVFDKGGVREVVRFDASDEAQPKMTNSPAGWG